MQAQAYEAGMTWMASWLLYIVLGPSTAMLVHCSAGWAELGADGHFGLRVSSSRLSVFIGGTFRVAQIGSCKSAHFFVVGSFPAFRCGDVKDVAELQNAPKQYTVFLTDRLRPSFTAWSPLPPALCVCTLVFDIRVSISPCRSGGVRSSDHHCVACRLSNSELPGLIFSV